MKRKHELEEEISSTPNISHEKNSKLIEKIRDLEEKVIRETEFQCSIEVPLITKV